MVKIAGTITRNNRQAVSLELPITFPTGMPNADETGDACRSI
jgi:hypothetical protein